MQLIIQAAAGMLVAISAVIFTIWLITVVNNPTCESTPAIGVWGANIVKTFALCWLG